MLLLFCMVFSLFSCGIGPVYSPELRLEDSGLDMHDKTVIVTKFYKAKSELTYTGDLNISRVLESAKLYDISFNVANHLKKEGLKAYSMKDAPANTLKKGEVMLSGAMITKSIPVEDNFPIPGMLVVFLIGNVLPSPMAYKSGVDVVFRYELIDSSGRILQSREKSSRIFYKDYYIWGRIFNYKKYEKNIGKDLQKQIYNLMIEDLFRQ